MDRFPTHRPFGRTTGGAIVSFDGIVRPSENERPIEALDYEAYQPMAEKQLRELAQSIVEENGLLAICVEHSNGRVPVGKCSFRLRIAATHRKEAIRAMDSFIDRLKQDVPIWKKAVYGEPETNHE